MDYDYAVNDYYGNEQSKREHIEPGKAVGEYRTRMADGTLQIVSYDSDDYGHRANVETLPGQVDTYAAPVDTYAAPVDTYAAPVDTYAAPVNTYAALAVESYDAPYYAEHADRYSAPADNYAEHADRYSAPADNYAEHADSYSAPDYETYSAPADTYSASHLWTKNCTVL